MNLKPKRFSSQQRTRILEAATQVFGEDGFHGATIRSVGRTAGVNSALLYYYFADKQTLFAEAVAWVLEEFLSHMDRRLAPLDSAEARVRFLVESVFSYFSAHPARLLLIGLATDHHPEVLGGAIRRLVDRGLPAPIRILQEGIACGELEPLNPLQAWWGLLGMCIYSLKLPRAFTPELRARLPLPVPSDQVRREQVVRMLLHGLARRTADQPRPRKRKEAQR